MFKVHHFNIIISIICMILYNLTIYTDLVELHWYTIANAAI